MHALTLYAEYVLDAPIALRFPHLPNLRHLSKVLERHTWGNGKSGAQITQTGRFVKGDK
jgi:hypothetical protein